MGRRVQKGPFFNGILLGENKLNNSGTQRFFIARSTDSYRYRCDFGCRANPRGEQYANERRQNPRARQDDEFE